MLPEWLFALLILGVYGLLHFTGLADKTPVRPMNGKKIRLRRNREFLNNWL